MTCNDLPIGFADFCAKYFAKHFRKHQNPTIAGRIGDVLMHGGGYQPLFDSGEGKTATAIAAAIFARQVAGMHTTTVVCADRTLAEHMCQCVRRELDRLASRLDIASNLRVTTVATRPMPEPSIVCRSINQRLPSRSDAIIVDDPFCSAHESVHQCEQIRRCIDHTMPSSFAEKPRRLIVLHDIDRSI